MHPDRRARWELRSQLLGSLLVHLALVLAIVGSCRKTDGPAAPTRGLELVYLEAGRGGPQPRQDGVERAVRPPRHPAPVPAGAPPKGAAARRSAAGAGAATSSGSGSGDPAHPLGARAGGPDGAFRGAGAHAPGAAGEAAGAKPAPAGAAATLAGPGAPSAPSATAARTGSPGTGAANGPGGGPRTVSGGSGTTAPRASAAKAGGGRGALGGAPASPGSGGRAPMKSYRERLKSLVEAHKEYPLAARRSGREGSCQRRFVLARDGSLKRVEALTSCGHPFLDSAATRAITGVGKFPPLPDEYPGVEEAFTVIMTFALSGR